MPRYFFKMSEGLSNTIVEDREGIRFTSMREVRKEAIDLAIDIAEHEFRGTNQTSEIIVTNEKGNVVLTVPLSKIRFRKIRNWLKRRRYFIKSRKALAERAMAWLVIMAAFAVALYTIAAAPFATELRNLFYFASNSTGEIVFVRFVPQANMAAVTDFLRTYNASLVNGPRVGGLYRLRIKSTALEHENLAEILSQMGREKIVASAHGSSRHITALPSRTPIAPPNRPGRG